MSRLAIIFRLLHLRFLFSHVALSLFSTWCLIGSVFATDIIVDNKDPEKTPQLTKTSMGIPQVDIVKSQEGVSHNRFEQYNVGTQGVVINNGALDKLVDNLGTIGANKNLTESAKTILFEVTGASRSELLGTTTIAGDQAKFILANPNGITCNGCGFINTHDVELRTDKLHSIVNGEISWEKDLSGDIRIGKEGISVRDKSLVLSSGKIKIEGAISAKELLRAEAHANIVGSNEEEYAIDVNTIAPIKAGKVYLIATGEGAGVRVSAPEFLINDTSTMSQDVANTNKDGVYIEAKKGDISISGASMETNGSFKFVGKNLKNQSILRAKNIESDLSDSFINNGDIQTKGDWYSTSRGFTNYQKMNINDTFQAKGESFVNDRGGHMAAKKMVIYLTGKMADGNSLYQGANSILESGAGGMDLVTSEGGMYFGYKKEPTGAGDNKDGFTFIGSQLLGHGGAIHIQSGGNVIFDGAQILGDITVESKGEVKENNPTVTGAYRSGAHDVYGDVTKIHTVMKPGQRVHDVEVEIPKVRTVMKSQQITRTITEDVPGTRTVTKPVIATRQVIDHYISHCKGVDTGAGCIGGYGYIPVYRTESYTTQVSTQEAYTQKVTRQITETVQVPVEEHYTEKATNQVVETVQISTEEKYVVQEVVVGQEPSFQDVVLKAKFEGNKQLFANRGDLKFKEAAPYVSTIMGKVDYLKFFSFKPKEEHEGYTHGMEL